MIRFILMPECDAPQSRQTIFELERRVAVRSSLLANTIEDYVDAWGEDHFSLGVDGVHNGATPSHVVSSNYDAHRSVNADLASPDAAIREDIGARADTKTETNRGGALNTICAKASTTAGADTNTNTSINANTNNVTRKEKPPANDTVFTIVSDVAPEVMHKALQFMSNDDEFGPEVEPWSDLTAWEEAYLPSDLLEMAHLIVAAQFMGIDNLVRFLIVRWNATVGAISPQAFKASLGIVSSTHTEAQSS